MEGKGSGRPLRPTQSKTQLPVGRKPPRLQGRKLARYNADGVTMFVNYYVCDAPFCLVSVARLILQGYWTVLGKGCVKLLTPDDQT